MEKVRDGLALWLVLAGLGAFIAQVSSADQDADLPEELRRLREQNELLQKQVQKQQEMIDDLNRRVSEIQPVQEKRDAPSVAPSALTQEEPPGPAGNFLGSLGLGKVRLGAEGGLAFFRTESHGQFPNSEFRVDEAKLFAEAPIWKDVYFFTELNITLREEGNEDLRVGELYVDFENVSRLWNRERQVNLRVGRFDIPFGEEYLVRDAIDNPLISHSLGDLWGVDEGIELYGTFGKVHYAAAVQNGGHPSLRDFDSDKSIAARLSYDPAKWLRVSASAMRTGKLDAEEDFFSELWFGNDWIHSLGNLITTTSFEANVFEGDLHLRLPRGHLKAAGGVLRYDDNDVTADNRRDVYYYYVEGQQYVVKKLYAAARWSQILVEEGFPILAHGDLGENLYGELSNDQLTDELWRLSLGVGYRWSENLLFKTEYTFEQGTRVGPGKRSHQNFLGAEVAFKF